MERWTRLYGVLIPAGTRDRYAYLFDARVELPEPWDPHESMEARAEKVGALRAAAVEDIGARGDRLEILSAIAASVSDGFSLGWAMGRSSLVGELDDLLVSRECRPKLLPAA